MVREVTFMRLLLNIMLYILAKVYCLHLCSLSFDRVLCKREYSVLLKKLPSLYVYDVSVDNKLLISYLERKSCLAILPSIL